MCVSALYLSGIVDLEPFGTRLGRYKLAHLIVKKEQINVTMKLLHGLYLTWANCSTTCWQSFVKGVTVSFKVREIDNDNLFAVINENGFHPMKYGNKTLKSEIARLFRPQRESVPKREQIINRKSLVNKNSCY